MATTFPEVTHADIPNFWPGDVDDFDVEYLDSKLGEVVDQINDRYGSAVRRRLDSGKLTERMFKGVVVRVASRVWANVEGFRRENGGQYGYELDPRVASGTIWFTDDDERDLTGINPKQSSVLGTASIGLHNPGRRW